MNVFFRASQTMGKLAMIILLEIAVEILQMGSAQTNNMNIIKLMDSRTKFHDFQEILNQQTEPKQEQRFNIPFRKLRIKGQSKNKYVKKWIKNALSDNNSFKSIKPGNFQIRMLHNQKAEYQGKEKKAEMDLWELEEIIEY